MYKLKANPYSGISYRVPKVLLSGNHKLIDEWKGTVDKNGGIE